MVSYVYKSIFKEGLIIMMATCKQGLPDWSINNTMIKSALNDRVAMEIVDGMQ